MKRILLKYTGNILALGCLFCLFAACSTGGGQAQNIPTATPTATPTPGVPSGTVLYQSDWSKGLTSWRGSTGWTIVQGNAQSDTNQNDALIVPYTPNIPYALEYRFQIVSVPQNGGAFFLEDSQTPTLPGFEAGILDLRKPGGSSEFSNPQIQVNLVPLDAMDGHIHPADYEGGSIWHTFRVEVRGPAVKFITDDLSRGSGEGGARAI